MEGLKDYQGRWIFLYFLCANVYLEVFMGDLSFDWMLIILIFFLPPIVLWPSHASFDKRFTGMIYASNDKDSYFDNDLRSRLSWHFDEGYAGKSYVRNLISVKFLNSYIGSKRKLNIFLSPCRLTANVPRTLFRAFQFFVTAKPQRYDHDWWMKIVKKWVFVKDWIIFIEEKIW